MRLNIKKALSLLMSIILLGSIIDISNIKTYAYDCNKDFNFSYSGTIADDVFGNRDCTFSINHITDNKFSGHFYVQTATFFQKVDKDVTGTISYIKGD